MRLQVIQEMLLYFQLLLLRVEVEEVDHLVQDQI
jgi:hypothetical protein